jgi:hypothetical protein
MLLKKEQHSSKTPLALPAQIGQPTAEKPITGSPTEISSGACRNHVGREQHILTIHPSITHNRVTTKHL